MIPTRLANIPTAMGMFQSKLANIRSSGEIIPGSVGLFPEPV